MKKHNDDFIPYFPPIILGMESVSFLNQERHMMQIVFEAEVIHR